MSFIKAFYEEEIFARAANNPNPLPPGTHVGRIPSKDVLTDWDDETDWNVKGRELPQETLINQGAAYQASRNSGLVEGRR